MGWFRTLLLLTSTGCAAPGSSLADGVEQAPLPERLELSKGAQHEALALTVENDGIIGTDNNYTNGVALTWISRERQVYPEDSLRRRWVDLGSFLPFVGDPGYKSFASIGLGQEMFTPDSILTPTHPPDDRPYAGILFLDTSYFALRERTGHAWNLRLGVVGPASGAADAQRSIHKWTGSDGPIGWSEQLPNEPVMNLDYSVAHQLYSGGTGSYGWRLVPVGGGGVGTYFTGLGSAIYGELGWNLAEAVSHISVRRGIDPFTAIGAKGPVPFSISVIAGGGAFAVMHYLPLDGNVFRGGPSVSSEPLIGFVTGGLSVRRGPLGFGLLLTSFTETFEGQPGSERFGTFTFSYTF